MIEARNIQKYFGKNHVLRDCSLTIDQGEIITLLGASGCGKTTLLRCIAGFEEPQSGNIVLGGKDVTRVPPNRRDVGFVFQNYALFPHMTVGENVAYGMSVRGVAKSEISERVAKALDNVSLQEFADRYPKSLSGGQQQRVALARSMVLDPKVLLMDEAFNALDAKLRGAMQVELRKIVKRIGITAVCVTHDQMEALTISDRIAVMAAGRIEQFATPYEVYDHPTTGYVADFIGAANVFSFSDAQRWGYKPDIQAVNAGTIVVRPENLSVYVAPDGPDTPTINFARLTGPGVEYEIGLGDGRVVRALVDRMDHEPIQVGAPVELAIRKSELCQPISSDNEQFASTNRAQS